MPLSEHQPRVLAMIHVVLVDLEGSFDLMLKRYFVQITCDQRVDQINVRRCDTVMVDRTIQCLSLNYAPIY